MDKPLDLNKPRTLKLDSDCMDMRILCKSQSFETNVVIFSKEYADNSGSNSAEAKHRKNSCGELVKRHDDLDRSSGDKSSGEGGDTGPQPTHGQCTRTTREIGYTVTKSTAGTKKSHKPCTLTENTSSPSHIIVSSFASREFYPGNAFLFPTSARQVQVSRGSLNSLWGSLGRLSLESSYLQILLHTLLRMMRMRAAHFLDHLTLSNIAALSFSSMALQHLAPMAQFFCILNVRLFAHLCSAYKYDHYSSSISKTEIFVQFIEYLEATILIDVTLPNIEKVDKCSYALKHFYAEHIEIYHKIAFQFIASWGYPIDFIYVAVDLQADITETVVVLDEKYSCTFFEALLNAKSGTTPGCHPID
ncbi:hypothetical protein DdX_13809 [Ditylenchus destructor]|uniref:Uncharacterized protein n=1 Tax=Ditylenchus destructor TaxID=166010 RepID=A0AAD4MY20_9BILA|nr:hypothetical protein DdX_13809 [Ditylenchus destructor]